jgi:hypothetical protein
MTTNGIDVTFHGSSFPATYIVPGALQVLGFTSTANLLIGNPLFSDDGDISGYFTGAGNVVDIPVGTEVAAVTITDVTDNIRWDWYRGMAATNTIKTVAAGTRTVDTTSAISVSTDLAGNSTITLSAALAAASSLLIYEIEG